MRQSQEPKNATRPLKTPPLEGLRAASREAEPVRRGRATCRRRVCCGEGSLLHRRGSWCGGGGGVARTDRSGCLGGGGHPPAPRQSRASPRRQHRGGSDRGPDRPAFGRRRIRAAARGATVPLPRFRLARGLPAANARNALLAICGGDRPDARAPARKRSRVSQSDSCAGGLSDRDNYAAAGPGRLDQRWRSQSSRAIAPTLLARASATATIRKSRSRPVGLRVDDRIRPREADSLPVRRGRRPRR